MASKPSTRELPLQTLFSEQLGLALIVLLFLLATLTWQLFFAQTLAAWLPGMLGTLLGFTFVGMFFFVGATLWHNSGERLAASFSVTLPLLWYLPWQLAVPVIAVSAALIWSAIALIHMEQYSRIRFQFISINNAGKFAFVLALSLALSVAYYSRLQDASWERIIADYKIGETTNTFIYKVLGFITPELRQTQSEEGATVDEYLTVQFQQSMADAQQNFFNNQALLDQYLDSGRQQLSHMVGRPVKGEEPISGVLAEYTRVKLMEAVRKNNQAELQNGSGQLALLLAVVLFLALLPLASLFAFFWILLGFLVFLYLLHTDQVKIVEQLKPVEALVETPDKQ